MDVRPKFGYAKVMRRTDEKFGTPEEFALTVGLAFTKIRARLDNSADFRLSEMDRACEFLGIRDGEVEGVFFEGK